MRSSNSMNAKYIQGLFQESDINMKPYEGYTRKHGCAICRLVHAQHICPAFSQKFGQAVKCPTSYQRNFCYNCVGAIPFIDFFK